MDGVTPGVVAIAAFLTAVVSVVLGTVMRDHLRHRRRRRRLVNEGPSDD